MKQKLKLFLVIGGIILVSLSLFYFNKLYYSINGYDYLKPGESMFVKVNPDKSRLDSLTELHLHMIEGEKLYLSGSNLWAVSTTKNYSISHSDTFYYYDTKKQSVEKHFVQDGSIMIESVTNNPMQGISLYEAGILFSSKNYTVFLVTEEQEYFIKISNMSKKPTVFSIQIVNR